MVASPDEALGLILRDLRPVGTERVGLADAPGRVLGEAIAADRPSPACDVSAMDGFALRVQDARSAGASAIPIAGEVWAGQPPPSLPDGSAIRIATGAPVPSGADAVIPLERVSERDGGIRIGSEALGRLQAGAHIRRCGENIEGGGIVLESGVMLTPARIGVLASFGQQRAMVRRRVRVAIISTGDEVVDAGEQPRAWQVRNSNGPGLCAWVRGHAIADVQCVEHVPDSLPALERSLGEAIESADLVLMTGGASVGARDHAPAALAGVGARILFRRVAQRPGRPMIAAIGARGTPILALAGNPVSALVAVRRYAEAVMECLAGLDSPRPPLRRIVNPDEGHLDLWWYRLVRDAGDGLVELVRTRGSGDLPSAAGSDGFVQVPPGCAGPGPWPFFEWSPRQ